MSEREQGIYKKLVQTDERKSAELRRAAKEAGERPPAAVITEPIETMFFRPTQEDRKIARKWQRRLGDQPAHDMQSLFTAIRLIARGMAVPLSCLETLRQFDRDREDI